MRSTYMHLANVAGFAAHGASTSGVVPVALMVGLCLLGVVVTLIMLFGQPPTERQDGADGDSGPGGGGPGGPSPEGGEPVWWPEFERQFADYVTSTTRAPARLLTASRAAGSSGGPVGPVGAVATP